MRADWESHLERWTSAGVVEPAIATRIRAWELDHARPGGLRWPVLIALIFGALLLGTGVLLFVSAHWDELSSSQRMTLVLLMIGVFHFGGAFTASRFEGLSIALHTIGTVALGAGIGLAGQIFHLSEHWPAAILLWAIGAALGWALLGHWTQAALTAILVPHWLAGEWSVRMSENRTFYMLPVSAGICALSFTYLTARRGPLNSTLRKTLCWLGAIVLQPAVVAIALDRWPKRPSWQELAVAWTLAIVGPIAVASFLRGRAAIWNCVATAWILVLAALNNRTKNHIPVYVYAWCAVGAIGLVAWGIREARPERINLGMAGFAVDVMAFYFSDIMDKLDRSVSLIVLGLLFLGGGWLLERTRRQLIAQIRPEPA